MERLKWIQVVLLLPILCCFQLYQLEHVIFSYFADNPADIEATYHGIKPSLISCGIHCINFPRVAHIVACKDSNNTIDCYCIEVANFTPTKTDQSCSVFTMVRCKNGGHFDGKVCNCTDSFDGFMCEINREVTSNPCLNETRQIVDPMTTAAFQDVLGGKGTLKLQVHIDNHDVIYNTIFYDHNGILESVEHIDIDMRNRSNLEVYLAHRMFKVNDDTMVTLRLGFGNESSMEMTTEANHIQFKGLIKKRFASSNVACLEVSNGQIVKGSIFNCSQGLLKGFAPTFTKYSFQRVDSVHLSNNTIEFIFVQRMVRNGAEYANNPALSDHRYLDTSGVTSVIHWNLNSNSLSSSINRNLSDYSIYLDTCWHLAYITDTFGYTEYGLLSDLYDSAVSGKRIRVAMGDFIYTVSITHLIHEEIAVTVTDSYFGDAWVQKRPVRVRQEVSTSGHFTECSFLSDSDLETSSSSGLVGIKWFVENRSWKEIIKYGSDIKIVSGTMQELFREASTGRSLRILVAYSPTMLEIIDVNIVHLFNSSRVVLDTGSFGIIEPSQGGSKCLQKSYSFYSDGALEYSVWPATRKSPLLRRFVNSYNYIQVLSEQ